MSATKTNWSRAKTMHSFLVSFFSAKARKTETAPMSPVIPIATQSKRKKKMVKNL